MKTESIPFDSEYFINILYTFVMFDLYHYHKIPVCIFNIFTESCAVFMGS